MSAYRQRAYDLALRLDARAAIQRELQAAKKADRDVTADVLECAAGMLRHEILIGPRTADLVRIILDNGFPTAEQIERAREEVGDIDDVIPF